MSEIPDIGAIGRDMGQLLREVTNAVREQIEKGVAAAEGRAIETDARAEQRELHPGGMPEPASLGPAYRPGDALPAQAQTDEPRTFEAQPVAGPHFDTPFAWSDLDPGHPT